MICPNKYIIIKKATSILVVCLFFLSCTIASGQEIVGTGGVTYEITGPEESAYARFEPETFAIPTHLGEVKYKFKGPSDKFVIHIQDAHCNCFAQKRISDIIDFIVNEYGIDVINLEGGVGDYDLAIFTTMTGRDVRREVSEHFVKNGSINGAEFYAINNPGKATLWGVEDKDLYLANLKVYRNSLLYKEQIEKYMKELTHVLNNLKRHIFTPELLRMDISYSTYKAGNMEFRDYLEFLVGMAGEAGVSLEEFGDIYLLWSAMQQEEKIDFKQANIQRNKIIDELEKKLSKKETRELVAKTLDFKTERITRGDYYKYLLDRGRSLEINLKRYSMLSDYIDYVSTYEAVDKFNVMDELDSLEEAIKGKLYRNDTERRLNVLSRNLALMKNMFGFSLTRSDYSYYTKNSASFGIANYMDFIRKEAPKYRITAELSPGIEGIDELREEVARFFEYSFKRDEVFLENMRFDLVEGGYKGAILMTGGFHTDNLYSLFKKEGIQCVSILPKFKSEKGYESPYFALLAGESAGVEGILRPISA